MRNGIPDHSRRIAPLRNILEKAFQKSGKRTKRSIKRIPLKSLGWGDEHEFAFRGLQKTLTDQIKLAHRDSNLALCIYTDASDRFWASVVTQCASEELSKPVLEQAHQPLAFLSGEFSGAELGWTTFEKEVFAILQTFTRLDHMLQCESLIRIFTDHRNLLFVFCPSILDPSLGRHKAMKVMRWAIFLSQFSYKIEHVDGENNVMPDIMTRWLRGYRGHRAAIKRVGHRVFQQDIVPSPLSENFDWPDIHELLNVQQQYYEKKPKESSTDDNGLVVMNGRMWVPEDAEDLQWRLLITAHCGSAGHRGIESTRSVLHEQFTWQGLYTDTMLFVSNCIHCLMSKTGQKIPRPLSLTLHATKPNEVVNFDFLYLGQSYGDMKYVLVMNCSVGSTNDSKTIIKTVTFTE